MEQQRTRTEARWWIRIGVVGTAFFMAAATTAGPVAAKAKKKVTATTIRVPRHGDPCTTRGAQYPGTALDCVEIAGRGLQWRIRGTVLNPYRLNEPVELYQLQSGRVRVVLTQWDTDVTAKSTSLGYDPTPAKTPGTSLLAYRAEVTILSSGPGALNRASDSVSSVRVRARPEAAREPDVESRQPGRPGRHRRPAVVPRTHPLRFS